MLDSKYLDVFIDFDDTIYDTYGNAQVALAELYEDFQLGRYFARLEDFTSPYWTANMDLWTLYNKGEIERSYLIVERFRRPLSFGSMQGTERDEMLSEEYCLKVSDHFLDLCSNKPGLIDGAREMLDYLQQRGYRMHICSNGFHEIQYKKLKASDTARYFDNVILSEDAGVNKPAKEYFDYALQKCGAKAETTVMIGDNLNTDILGAQRAGIDTIYYNRWESPGEPDCTYHARTLREIISVL